jgi:ketosteroid isomerase-like protein
VAWLVLAPVGTGLPGPAADNPAPTVALAPGRTESVRLAFDAPKRLEGARLTMRLPENFELAGHPERRELTWTTELEAGRNLLELPVRALADGEGELIAEIAHGDTVKRLSIRLRAEGPAASLTPNPAPAA